MQSHPANPAADSSTSGTAASATPSVLPANGRIVVRGICRSFGDKIALHPLDLELGPGGVNGLLGPNGSGKSTLMRCLVGLVRPDAGTAEVDGVPLAGDGIAIRRRVTYAPGEMQLYREMSGREHLGWLLRGRSPESVRAAVELAAGFELPLGKRVRGYSHGMKRLLVFAAAMAPDVQVRILDEPTEGLDPTRRSEVLDALTADAAAGRTVLLSSHHLGEVDRACDRLVFMNEGRLVADETAASVHERASRLVRVSWPEHHTLNGVEQALEDAGAASIRREGNRVSFMIASEDPREFLAAFARRTELPAPTSIEHGRLSLQELYRSLYGVEGC